MGNESSCRCQEGLFCSPSSIHGDHSKADPGLSVLVPILVSVALVSGFEDSDQTLTSGGSLSVHSPERCGRGKRGMMWDYSAVLDPISNAFPFQQSMVFRGVSSPVSHEFRGVVTKGTAMGFQRCSHHLGIGGIVI